MAKTCWDGPDKMPTKIWDGQNANHRKKSGQNANFWLAFCLVGILSGWHFVLPPQKHPQALKSAAEVVITTNSIWDIFWDTL